MNRIPLPPLLELASAQLEVALQNSNAQVERLAASVDAISKLGARSTAELVRMVYSLNPEGSAAPTA